MVFDANFAFDRPTTMHVQTARPFPSDITAVLVEKVKDLKIYILDTLDCNLDLNISIELYIAFLNRLNYLYLL